MFQLSEFKGKYRPDGRVKIVLWMFISAFLFEGRLPLLNSRAKLSILRLFGCQAGQRIVIKPSVKIKYPWLLTLGDDVWIGERVWIDNVAPITIGSNVCISQGVSMESGNHDHRDTGFKLLLHPIEIGSNVWVGCHAVLLPNARVPDGSFIRAGTVYRKETQRIDLT